MSDRIYGIRYEVERWDRPRGEGTRVAPNIVVSGDDHGYCDAIFVASILNGPDGKPASILLLGTDGDSSRLTREVLEAVSDQIDHYLKEHL